MGGLVLLLTAFSLSGSPDGGIAKCREMEDSLLRLQCYDALPVSNGDVSTNVEPGTSAGVGDSSQEEGTGKGGWVVSKDSDPLSDVTTSSAVLVATEGKSKHGKSIALIVRCSQKELDIFIHWNEYLGSKEWVEVAARFDKGTPSTAYWKLSASDTATFADLNTHNFGKRKKYISEIARNLRNSKIFVAQTYPLAESKRTAVFELTGAGEAFDQMSENTACKSWLGYP